jgi:hypothetical protein
MSYEVVRAMGVAWVGVLCFVFAFLVSRFVDNFTPKLDKTNPKWRIFAEVCVQFGIVAIIVFGARVFIKKIPFPLEGWCGYEHAALGELRSLPLMVFIFMFFQVKTQEKMKFLST